MFKSSLKYKMLHLVIAQGVFLAAVLISISFINPSWVLWNNTDNTSQKALIKSFKHNYGMLNSLSMQLTSLRTTSQTQIPNSDHLAAAPVDFNVVQQSLFTHIDAIKALSKKGQQTFNVDFSVLVSFLFRYQDQIKHLEPLKSGLDERLWLNQLFFSRIQSELLYITEEIERYEANKNLIALNSAQKSLFIWTVASLMLLAISTFIALSYAIRWKEKIASLLNLAYRASMKTNNTHPIEIPESNDELDYLVEILHAVLGDKTQSKENIKEK